ncbi:MAG: alpha/beta fold hydrolase [Betaproteobacteria bacterium]|nr:alpha/beta fold hydrolase [Betaproteobacteria bacterium]
MKHRLNPLQYRKSLLAFAFALLAAISGCAWLDQKQGSLIFNPVQGEWRGYRGLPEGMQEESIPVGPDGDRVHAWWMPAQDPQAPALLYLHGARWNLTGSVTRIPRWHQMGFSVLAIDYRGFGRSESKSVTAPTEQSSIEDAKAAYARLVALAPQAKRYIFGHSLGGSIATQLAARQPDASGLILEGAFTNIPQMIKETKWGFLPVSFLVTQRFDTLEAIDDIAMPVLIAHGTADNIVPFAMGEKLFAAAREPKRFFRAEGGSHHNMSSTYFDGYRNAVREFFGLGRASASAASAPSISTRTTSTGAN